jgi:hypothetical protein
VRVFHLGLLGPLSTFNNPEVGWFEAHHVTGSLHLAVNEPVSFSEDSALLPRGVAKAVGQHQFDSVPDFEVL